MVVKQPIFGLSEPQKRAFVAVAIILAIIVASGVGLGVWMIVSRAFVFTDALWVMATPFIGVIVLTLVAAGIFAFTRSTATQVSLRLRIVGVLAVVLVIGVAGSLVLVLRGGTVPEAFTTLLSTITGGLIGVLTPQQSAGGGARPNTRDASESDAALP